MKKLLGRMDTKEYTLLLENTLENLGVDVEAMQSNYLFRKHSFDWETKRGDAWIVYIYMVLSFDFL